MNCKRLAGKNGFFKVLSVACACFTIGLRSAEFASDQCPTIRGDGANDRVRRLGLLPLFSTLLLGALLIPSGNSAAQCHILWTDEVNNEIRRLGQHETQFTTVVTGIEEPSYLALDPRGSGTLYVSSEDKGTIHRANLNGTGLQLLLSGLTGPRELVVDSTNNKLYWAENDTQSLQPALVGDAQIKRANLDGSNVEVVVDDLNFVADFILLPNSGGIIWSESLGFDAALKQSDLNGSNIQTLKLVQGDPDNGANGAEWGFGLSVPATNSSPEKIYWGVSRAANTGNAAARILEVAVENGNTNTVVELGRRFVSSILTLGERPTGIELNEAGQLFWSEPTAYGNINRFSFEESRKNDVTPRTEEPFLRAPTDLELIAAGQGDLCAQFPVSAEVQDSTVWRPTLGMWYLRRSIEGFKSYTNLFLEQWGLPIDAPLLGDKDGDGNTDLVVWRPITGDWWRCDSRDSGLTDYFCSGTLPEQFGLIGDYPLAGDFDGDGKSDLAVWRPATGEWYMRESSDSEQLQLQWGLPGDIPVPADFDQDGVSDLVVWRPATGTWYTRLSSNGFSNAPDLTPVQQWGLPEDHPMPGDYDGDQKADYAVWRPSNGTWYLCSSTSNYDCSQGVAIQFGLPGDVPISLDFDHDGRLDYVVWRPSSGTWYYMSSSTGEYAQQQWGLPDDIPVPGSMRNLIERLY